MNSYLFWLASTFNKLTVANKQFYWYTHLSSGDIKACSCDMKSQHVRLNILTD